MSSTTQDYAPLSSQRSIKKYKSLMRQFITQAGFTVILLIASFVMTLLLKNQKQRVSDAQEQKELLMLAAAEARQSSQNLTRLCRLFVITGEEKYRLEYFNLVKWQNGDIPRPDTVHEKLFPGRKISRKDLLKELGCTIDEIELLNKTAALSEDLTALEKQAMASVKYNRYIEGPAEINENEDIKDFAARIVHNNDYHEATERIMQPLNEFLKKLDIRISGVVRKANIGLTTYLTITLIFILLVIISVISFIININFTVIRPILKTSQVFSYLGQGDLRNYMEIKTSNEIGRMASDFNETLENIKNLISAIMKSTDTLSEIGNILSVNMTETASAVYQISANIKGVKEESHTQAESVTETAAAMEEIISTIKKLDAAIEIQAARVSKSLCAIEQMTENISSATQTLIHTDEVIQTLANATEDGKNTISNSNSVTQKITEESGSLLEASSVIQHIASQTNLLAMNAAIEAAHAGEAGKGFAVVADEIRKLAEESSSQGKAITETLKILSGEIDILSNSAKTAEEKFNAIFNLSDTVKNMSNGIMDTMKKQEHESREVLTAIKDINAITMQINDESTQMLNGSKRAADEMDKLDQLTALISGSMDEMAAGVSQINLAIQEVNEVTGKNKQSIAHLSSEVGKFKI